MNGGPWVYPDRWTRGSLARESDIADPGQLKDLADEGTAAARDLQPVMKGESVRDDGDRDGDRKAEGVRLASYLAVVVQDIDGMGRFLSGPRVFRMPGARVRPGTPVPTGPGLSQARARLGEDMVRRAGPARTVTGPGQAGSLGAVPGPQHDRRPRRPGRGSRRNWQKQYNTQINKVRWMIER